VIIPPLSGTVDVSMGAAPGEGPRDELAALEAGWDELLTT
jgi:hypothetical protein